MLPKGHENQLKGVFCLLEGNSWISGQIKHVNAFLFKQKFNKKLHDTHWQNSLRIPKLGFPET